MNFLRTPDDSTAVVKIMGEFDQFLTSDPRGRLTFEEPSDDGHGKSQRPSSTSFAKNLNKSWSQGSLLSKERVKDVELIKSRSKIAHLESQMNVLESERKRARIEFERENGNDKLERQGTELAVMQNKLGDTEGQLENVKRRLSVVMTQLPELEQLRESSRTAEHRVKELEQKLSRQDEATGLAMAMQTQLTKYRELEKENAKLKDENHYYSEYSVLPIKDPFHNRSPAQLAQDVANLQKGQVVLLETQSELKSSAQIHETAYHRAVQELAAVKKESAEFKENGDRQKEVNQRLQRRLFLVTAERDGCRRILDTYDSSYSSNYDPHIHSRLQEAEARLKTCHEHIETLELEVNQKADETSKERLRANQLEVEICELRDNVAKQTPTKPADSALRTELEKLQAENAKLQEQLEIYEINKDQMHMRGYYDPTKTKIVHLSMNPSSVARQQRGEELEKLKKENECLRRKLKLLEEGGSSSNDTSLLSKLSPETAPSVVREVEDFKAQLSSAEMKNQRLKEVFKKKIQEFREACYALTGYKIDVIRDNQYRLQSMYAERSSDDLLFEDEDDEVTVEEATKFLQGAGIIKARDIHYLSEDEKEKISRESSEPLSENQEKKKVKEMTMADASNIQTYYKSSRLGIKDIENQMTEEELDQEKEMRRKQLEEIFKLLETDRDKYGVTTMDDLQAQMKLYSR
ncbi:Mitotic spindle assembly checkpoint protein MAD1 [Stylophora pistillata]|uniref:Mitotic spindle assembly checkpoint protein MAD1 n=1 Tax=Stylophora pistillata TaxID=50429 RepID=A0A2B4SES0_STYPI|nr:Mitotic spindle assembly checkpoint protein MAD1 [Stylophora pistillata]